MERTHSNLSLSGVKNARVPSAGAVHAPKGGVKTNIRSLPKYHAMVDTVRGFHDFLVVQRTAVEEFERYNSKQRYDLFKDVVGFQFGVGRIVEPTLSARPFDNIGACYNACVNNNYQIWAALKPLRYKHETTFFNSMIPVFESFPKLFYCLHDAEDARLMYYCEERDYDELARRSEYGLVHHYHGMKPDGDYGDLKTHAWLQKEVYSDKKQADLDAVYNYYSVSSHSRLSYTYSTSVEELHRFWDVGLGILLSYSLLTALILVNVVGADLAAKRELDPARGFVKSSMKESWDVAGQHIELMYPDKGEYVKNLAFRLPIPQ